MKEQKQTIEQLLKSMYTLKKEGGVSDSKRVLENSLDTWKRIGNSDPMKDLFDNDEEREKAVKEFIEANEYSAIA